MSRRFATHSELLRAYAGHQMTRQGLKKLVAEAEAEQVALEKELCPLLARYPHGVRYQDQVLTARPTGHGDGRFEVVVTPAPVDHYDLDECPVPAADRDAGGADDYGMTEPYDPVPPNADSYPADETLATAGIEVRDDDGDDL